MAKSFWRVRALVVIEEVIKEYFLEKGYQLTYRLSKDELKTLKSRISKAYPFGKRSHYPYEIWLEEVQAHMRYLEGLPPLKFPSVKTRLKNAPVPPGQISLFNQPIEVTNCE